MAQAAALSLALVANTMLAAVAESESPLSYLVRREEAAFSFSGSNKCDVVVFLLGDARLDDLSQVESPVVVTTSGNASRVAFLVKRRARCVLVVTDDEAVLSRSDVVAGVLRAVPKSELIVLAGGDVGGLNETLRASLLKLKSNSIVASRQGNGSHWLYAVCPNCLFEKVPAAEEWTGSVATGTGKLPLTSRCCHALTGRTLGVSFVGSPPFIVYSAEKGQVATGVDVVLLNMLATKFNFTFRLVAEQAHGALNKTTGAWSGMVESVRSGRTSLGIGYPTMNLDRWQAVHFTSVNYPLEYTYASAAPQPTDPFDNVITVFQKQVWCATLASALLVPVAFAVFVEVYRVAGIHRHSATIVPSDLFMALVAPLSQQQSPQLFAKWSVGLLLQVLVWVAMGLFLSESYKSILLSHLISVEYTRPIETTDELVSSGRPLYLPSGSSLIASMETSPVEGQRLLVKRASDAKTFFTLENGDLPPSVRGDVLSARGAAFLTFKQGIMSSDFVCSQTEVILAVMTAFMVNKQEVWRDDFNDVIERFKAMGFVVGLSRTYSKVRVGTRPAKVQTSEGDPLGVAHVLSCIVLLAIGHTLAAVAFVVEITVGKRSKRALAARTLREQRVKHKSSYSHNNLYV